MAYGTSDSGKKDIIKMYQSPKSYKKDCKIDEREASSMNRKIVLYIATSLDGYIAKEDGTVDWLTSDMDLEETSHNDRYEAFYNTVDTVVMGSVTYDQVINELSPDQWVYEGKKCYVATSKKRELDGSVEFISEDITGFFENIKQEEGEDIWLVGGSKLIDQFIKEDLIDKYVITLIPIILGEGIPLFLNENPELKLRLVETHTTNGMVELIYVRK